MALIGVKIDATVDFESILDPEKGTPAATVFVLGSIPMRTRTRVRDNATKFTPDPENPDTVTAQFMPNRMAYDLVAAGLRGWKNFLNADGNEIAFKTHERQEHGVMVKGPTDETMANMSMDLIRELSEEIDKLNDLTEPEAKKSEE